MTKVVKNIWYDNGEEQLEEIHGFSWGGTFDVEIDEDGSILDVIDSTVSTSDIEGVRSIKLTLGMQATIYDYVTDQKIDLANEMSIFDLINLNNE